MTARIKFFVNRFGFIFLVFIAALFGVTGCATSTPNPLAGWKIDFDEQPSQAIEKDYHDYIQNLPPKQKGYIGNVSFLEDGTGQHAITIEVFEGNKNASWQHALIYNKEDKRIKAVIYVYCRYQS